VELPTERLVLRDWRVEDRERFAAINADPEVMEYFPSTLTRPQSDAMVDRIEGHLTQHGWGLWAVEVVESHDFIGFVGLARPNFEAHFTPAVEIGWRLARGTWGNGYAPEAGRAALAFAFDQLGLDEVVSFTAVANAKSRRVMEKLGLSRDPNGDFDHPNGPAGSPLRRHVLYRIGRAEYSAG
jgi:RimJ/RimL family protein N-acetyltransferase